MTIKTTANIDKSTYRQICEAAKRCGIKPWEMASILMKIVIKEKPLEIRCDRAVDYQKRRDKDLWKCFHLELTVAVYGACIDLRNLMKLSVPPKTTSITGDPQHNHLYPLKKRISLLKSPLQRHSCIPGPYR